jgi:hypothetical protein
LSQKNRAKNAFLGFAKMNWIDRAESEFDFVRQTYLFPLGSGLAFLFFIYQMMRD